jgi:hypothetical protein
MLIFYWKRVGHNTYEIWGGLNLLKGIFLGKTYAHTMYSECTGSLIQVSPHVFNNIGMGMLGSPNV